jgi:hypothetical protein
VTPSPEPARCAFRWTQTDDEPACTCPTHQEDKETYKRLDVMDIVSGRKKRTEVRRCGRGFNGGVLHDGVWKRLGFLPPTPRPSKESP